MKDYNVLFDECRIGELELKNRYVMGPMAPFGMVDSDGCFNSLGQNYYIERAKGGVGLIITGASPADNSVEDIIRPGIACPTINPASFARTSSLMNERIHAYGAKVFFQLAAGFGRIGIPHLFKNKIAPSNVKNRWDQTLEHRALSTEEVDSIVKQFGIAAAICKKGGFDGVEIHAVHEGYLLDQFALALFNKRTDKYGGDLRGRLKISTDIVKEIKKTCGEDFPVVMRFSIKSYMKDIGQGAVPGEDFKEIGRDFEEGIEAAKILIEAGYDGLDVDAGTYDSWYWNHPPMYFEDGMYLEFSKRLKDKMDCTIITAGRLDDPKLATKAVNEGITDFISLARPLLADPYIVKKIETNNLEKIRPCLSCHEACIGRIEQGKGISCAVNPAACREEEYALSPTLTPKKIMIVGAGLAGMEFARVAKTRGHSVAIYEKENFVGGNLYYGGQPSFKRYDRRLLTWYENELSDLEIPIYFNCEVDDELVNRKNPDVIVVATGSTPIVLNLPGFDDNNVYLAEDILVDFNKAKGDVTIIGAGLVGCELAYELSLKGHKVTLVEGSSEIMGGPKVLPFPNYDMLKDLLNYNKVEIIKEGVAQSFADGKLLVKQKEKEINVTTDTLIVAVGYKSNNELYKSLKNCGKDTYLLGDAQKVKNIMYAIWDAYEVARSI